MAKVAVSAQEAAWRDAARDLVRDHVARLLEAPTLENTPEALFVYSDAAEGDATTLPVRRALDALTTLRRAASGSRPTLSARRAYAAALFALVPAKLEASVLLQQRMRRGPGGQRSVHALDLELRVTALGLARQLCEEAGPGTPEGDAPLAAAELLRAVSGGTDAVAAVYEVHGLAAAALTLSSLPPRMYASLAASCNASAADALWVRAILRASDALLHGSAAIAVDALSLDMGRTLVGAWSAAQEATRRWPALHAVVKAQTDALALHIWLKYRVNSEKLMDELQKRAGGALLVRDATQQLLALLGPDAGGAAVAEAARAELSAARPSFDAARRHEAEALQTSAAEWLRQWRVTPDSVAAFVAQHCRRAATEGPATATPGQSGGSVDRTSGLVALGVLLERQRGAVVSLGYAQQLEALGDALAGALVAQGYLSPEGWEALRRLPREPFGLQAVADFAGVALPADAPPTLTATPPPRVFTAVAEAASSVLQRIRGAVTAAPAQQQRAMTFAEWTTRDPPLSAAAWAALADAPPPASSDAWAAWPPAHARGPRNLKLMADWLGYYTPDEWHALGLRGDALRAWGVTPGIVRAYLGYAWNAHYATQLFGL